MRTTFLDPYLPARRRVFRNTRLFHYAVGFEISPVNGEDKNTVLMSTWMRTSDRIFSFQKLAGGGSAGSAFAGAHW